MEINDIDAHFLDLCRTEAKAAKCTRRQVGSYLVKNGRHFSAGRNGTPAGEKNCTEGGCLRGLHYMKTPFTCGCGKVWPCEDSPAPNKDYGNSSCIHAEMNALLYADRDHTEGATLYCTHAPCHDCFKHIRAAGVIRIVAPDFEWNR